MRTNLNCFPAVFWKPALHRPNLPLLWALGRIDCEPAISAAF